MDSTPLSSKTSLPLKITMSPRTSWGRTKVGKVSILRHLFALQVTAIESTNGIFLATGFLVRIPAMLFILIFVGFQLQPSRTLAGTVCAVTLGSAEETQFFKSVVSPRDRFLELSSDEPNWLERSCQRNIKCDVVVISSHYDGVGFYGLNQSGNQRIHQTLSKAQILKVAANGQCENIFSQAKEVYLFGCNTLAQRGVAIRDHAVYKKALQEAGLGEWDTSVVLSQRYATRFPYDVLTYDWMRGVFRNAKILGFWDKGFQMGSILSQIAKDQNAKTNFWQQISGKDPSQVMKLIQKSTSALTIAKGFGRQSDPAGEQIYQTVMILNQEVQNGNARSQLNFLRTLFVSPYLSIYVDQLEHFLRFIVNHRLEPQSASLYENLSRDRNLENTILNYWSQVENSDLEEDTKYHIGIRLSTISIFMGWKHSHGAFKTFREVPFGD